MSFYHILLRLNNFIFRRPQISPKSFEIMRLSILALNWFTISAESSRFQVVALWFSKELSLIGVFTFSPYYLTVMSSFSPLYPHHFS